MDEWTQMDQSAPASKVVVVQIRTVSAVDIAVQAGMQKLDGLGRPFRTCVTKLKAFDDAGGRVQSKQMSRKNLI